jgi:hypothetical protein
MTLSSSAEPISRRADVPGRTAVPSTVKTRDPAPDLRVRRTYRGYQGSDVLAHVTAFSEDEAVRKLREHARSLTRVVVMHGMDETEVWTDLDA